MLKLTESVPSACSPPQDVDERRAWVRHPVLLESACQPIPLPHVVDPESQWPGRITNLSQGGMCLHLARRFEPGTPLLFDLPSVIPGATLTVTGTVAWVARAGGGGWALGCQFEVPLSEKQVNTLLNGVGQIADPVASSIASPDEG